MMSARPSIEFLRPKWGIWGLVLALAMVGAPTHSDDGPVITRINHSSLSGGRLQIDIHSSGALPSPRVFRTSENLSFFVACACFYVASMPVQYAEVEGETVQRWNGLGFLVERNFLVEKLDTQYAVVRPSVKDDVRELTAFPGFLNLP